MEDVDVANLEPKTIGKTLTEHVFPYYWRYCQSCRKSEVPEAAAFQQILEIV